MQFAIAIKVKLLTLIYMLCSISLVRKEVIHHGTCLCVICISKLAWYDCQ